MENTLTVLFCAYMLIDVVVLFVFEKCFVNCFRFKFEIKMRQGVLSRRV